MIRRKTRPGKKPSLTEEVNEILSKRKKEREDPWKVSRTISRRLLEMLDLNPEQLKLAKELEEHTLKLHRALIAHRKRVLLTAADTIEITERVLMELPAHMERHREQLRPDQITNLHGWIDKLSNQALPIMKAEKPGEPLSPSPGLLDLATTVHKDEVRHLLGDEKYVRYQKAMSKMYQVLAEGM